MSRTPYNGPSRKLVLAFDIGTTHSGAAYAFLDPGEVPQINSVTKYLDNPNVGSAKVPSILYYDQDGRFRGVENGRGLQDDENLVQMRWWKLLLSPTGPPAALIAGLPVGKTIVDVFADFMGYLFDSTKALFISSDRNGENRWNSVSKNIELVLTHPNGWGGPERSQLRTAAIQANIVPGAPEGREKVHFVTEGGASFNFCATHTQVGEKLKRGDNILVVDAGGGTIDISSYTVIESAPLQVEERLQPKCLLQGGEFVTVRAREMVSARLKKSRFNTSEDIDSFSRKFDEGLKRVFSGDPGIQYIKFGSPRDDDPKYGIKAGKLTLTGNQVSGFFEPSIRSTVDSIRENFTEILSMNSFAFLVGGFASNPWLSGQLNQRLSDLGLNFFKPDTNTDKAVAVGAVSVHLDRLVRGSLLHRSSMTGTPYNGTSRKLVLAFDIGTTHSSAAYAFLQPGKVPQINSVTKYLDNPNVGLKKVPSTLYYDQNGNFRGVGNGTGLQEDEDLIRMSWWKLLLSPTGPPATLRNHMSMDLPPGKTIVDIFSDFMRYLFDSTKALFISSDQNGEHRWNSVSHNIELVLTHPNGWGGLQKSQLRTAAVKANIVPSTPEGLARVHFVTEPEATFNFCATHTQSGEILKRGDSVLIVDAGKGTIDILSYTVTDKLPWQVEELSQPICLLQGGEFVTVRARTMISEKLRGSKFHNVDDLAAIAQKFDEGVKRTFSDEAKAQFIKFGSPRDNDPQHGIKMGKLALTGRQVSELFEPSIRATVDSIREHFPEILSMNSFVFLVGGFCSSPWLSSQLNRRLSDLGLKFFKPETNTDKAVAVGAVSYYIDHFFNARISRFTYGTSLSAFFLPHDPEHIRREHKSFVDELGDKWVPDAFTTMLSKGTTVRGSRESVHRKVTPATRAFAEIIKYDGSQGAPKWMDVDRDRFETLCHVVADISTAPYTTKVGMSGTVYHYREYEVALLVGLTDLKAQIRWIDSETGVEKRGNTVIVYNDASETS